MIKASLFATFSAIALTACSGSGPAPNAAITKDNVASLEQLIPAQPNATAIPPSRDDKGPDGARSVLNTWARALEQQQFSVAWEQFRNPPANRAAYTKWWARYRSIHVALGPGVSDAAMGSLYYTAPATLTGTTAAGKPFRLEGSVVLRRVNDVDGASPAQLQWHIQSADFVAADGMTDDLEAVSTP